MEGKLLTPVDPYLHREVIESSKTFAKLTGSGISAEDAVKNIRANDLLHEKHSAEGPQYRALMKDIYRKNHSSICSTTRRCATTLRLRR